MLSQEYFELVNEAVNNQKRIKRRKISVSAKPEFVVDVTESCDNNKEEEENYDKEENYDEEEFNSDWFEDIPIGNDSTGSNCISLTLESEMKVKPAKRRKTVVVDSETKLNRRFIHMFYLITILAHYHQRNDWLNDKKLHQKMQCLVPDKVFYSLNPLMDGQLPLRSSRKLVDGLKQCMKLWKGHCKYINDKNPGMYMWKWEELASGLRPTRQDMEIQQYIKTLEKGLSMSRKIAAEGFVALLRSCGVNARLVVSLQPPDFTDFKPVNPECKADSAIVSSNDDDRFKYPVIWCEVWDKFSKNWISVDPICNDIIEQVRYKTKLEPTGKFSKFNQLRYVIGFDRKGGCRDITRRYSSIFNAKTRNLRITRTTDGASWYAKVIGMFHKRKRTRIDDYEDQYFIHRDEAEGIPNNMADIKNHPYYILENDLRQNQVLRPGCEQCGFLRLKGTKHSAGRIVKVYKRQDILECHTARHWFMQGRILKTGCRPVRNIEVKNFKTGEVENERMYSIEETEYYVPPPVGPDHKISVNTYGNIDVYKPWMIPKECSLVESKHAVRAAAFINIPFAKAVTGFSFEKGRTVKPKLTGVVVELPYTEALCAFIEGIEFLEEEDRRKDRELDALRSWSMMLAQLRVKKRLNDTHGKVVEAPYDSESNTTEQEEVGGFIREAGTYESPEHELYTEEEQKRLTKGFMTSKSENHVTENIKTQDSPSDPSNDYHNSTNEYNTIPIYEACYQPDYEDEYNNFLEELEEPQKTNTQKQDDESDIN